MDLARSVQEVTETAVMRICRQAAGLTGSRNLCLAGGVALNCVANGKVLRSGRFDRIWIQPAAGDAGGALGAALLAHHRFRGNPRTPAPGDAMRGALLGPAYPDAAIETFLRERGAPYRKAEDETLYEAAAALPEARHLLVTDISRDGMLRGPNVALMREIAVRLPTIALQASGGVSGLADLAALAEAGAAAAIVGKALWEGRISLPEALRHARA